MLRGGFKCITMMYSVRFESVIMNSVRRVCFRGRFAEHRLEGVQPLFFIVLIVCLKDDRFTTTFD